MTLRLFRAPDLAFWSIAVLVLGGAVGFAAHLGGDEERAASAPGAPAVATALTSVSAEQVMNIQALMPAGTAAGIDPAALTAWAQAIGKEAQAGADIRAAEGAEEQDDLRSEFTQVVAFSNQLAQVAHDRVAATAVRTQIGLHSTRMSALIIGMPAPALPAGSTDLFGQTGSAPSQPVARDPLTPAVPTLPQDPAAIHKETP